MQTLRDHPFIEAAARGGPDLYGSEEVCCPRCGAEAEVFYALADAPWEAVGCENCIVRKWSDEMEVE